jgi:hypothetical protein
MRPECFAAESLLRLLRQRTIATMDELKAALGSTVDLTVFRKLQSLGYLASYSHRGRFYALQESAAYDERGLWSCRGVHFSQFGSLVDTVEVFVNRAVRGYLAAELAPELQVEVKEPLLKLVRAGRLSRHDAAGLYLYCAADRDRATQQLRARQLPVDQERAFAPRSPVDAESDEAQAAVVLFMSLLDEQQRRLFAGLESLRLGGGGDRAVADATGMDPHTIAKGRQQLLARDILIDRQRRPGAGRKPVEKKRPRSSPASKN